MVSHKGTKELKAERLTLRRLQREGTQREYFRSLATGELLDICICSLLKREYFANR